MSHHARRRHQVARIALRMLGDHVDASVAESVLLPKITAEAFAPSVHASSSRTESQLITRRAQPVAHVVVVSVAQALVEETDAFERIGAIGGIAGADVVGGTAKRAVSILEIEIGRAHV